jgi:nucleoside 2-deoxyribosyltransferase
MPFDPKFSDIYQFGIKGAAEEVGAYAERVDEQIFQEGILDRIFNQISKADVIVADMTGKNSNVFYEVGYAHALGKIVLLLTQSAEDIPFDLKHHQHIVYGDIQMLRNQLAKQLTWAIAESRRRNLATVSTERLRLVVDGREIPILPNEYQFPLQDLPLVEASPLESGLPKAFAIFRVRFGWENPSTEASSAITHSYLLMSSLTIRPSSLESYILTDNSDLPHQFRINYVIPSLPPKAVETIDVAFKVQARSSFPVECTCVYRLHGALRVYDYGFRLKLSDED